MANLPKLSPEVIKAYQDEISRNASPATAKRKAISLNRFFDWAETEGHIPQNPMSNDPSPTTSNVVISPSIKKSKISLKTWAVVGMTTGTVILIFLTLSKLKLPIPFITNFAQEANIQTTGTFPTPSSLPGSIPANSAVIAGWNLYAKLKLTSVNGTPQVGTQTLGFKIYNSPTGGDALYTSSSQSVTTDANGSVLISLVGVPTNLFFENEKLYLEPQVTGQSAPSQRILIPTANVASNLNEYPPANPDTGATPLTIPVIDASGNLALAGESAGVVAKTGNLLLEGQAVTLKTADGSGGNIEINPDANGYAHFLFEGSSGNFLNAQGPNLNKGSLYYGMVPNNATGYDLIKLQSGAPKMTTKFSVDALGNTYTGGNLDVDGGISTGGVERLTYFGELTNITGYSQVGGNFTIEQGPGDFASIDKTLTSGGALSDVLTLTLDERGKPATSNSDYSTLVLNRYDGNGAAMALLVNHGNAKFNGNVYVNGQLQLGNFSSLPTSVGGGSIIYNSTDNQVYFWNGSSWVPVGTATTVPFSGITSGTNTTAAMVVGTGASLTFSGTGTITASDVTCTGCVSNSELANSAITFAGDAGTTAVSLGGTENIVGGTAILTSQAGNTLTVGVAADSLDFTELKDSLTLDANTNIATAGLTLSTSGTGPLDFASTGQVTFAGNVDANNGLDVTGNLSVTGTTTFGGVAYTWPGADGNPGQALTTDGAGSLAWSDVLTDASVFWTQDPLTGVLYPKNSTVDVLIGGTSTASADFAFTGVDGGLPTASIAGTTPDVALYLTGNGNIATTNSAPLILGNALTSGAVEFFNASSNIDSSGNLTIAGNLDVNGLTNDIAGTLNLSGGTLTSTGTLDITPGGALTVGAVGQTTTLQGSTTSITSNGAGNDITLTSADQIILNAGSTIELQDNTNVTGVLTAGTTAGFTVDATGNITKIGGVAHTIQDATGDLRLTSNSTNIILNDGVTFASTTTLNGVTYTWPGAATAGYVLQANSTGASSSLSWVDPAAAVSAAIYWTQDAVNGVLYPKNNSVDVLIGSDSTASADFAFTGVDGGLPTASIAGNIANVATYIDGNGNISSTNRNDLTIGNSAANDFTGNVLINPNGVGNVGVGVTLPTSRVDIADASTTTGNIVTTTGTALTSGNVLNLVESGAQIFSGNIIQAEGDKGGGGTAFTGNFLDFYNAGSEKFKVDFAGNIATAGDAAINGGDITTTSVTGNIFNSTATVNLGTSSTTVNIGNTLTNVTGDLDVSGQLTSGAANGFHVDATGNITSIGGVAHAIQDATGDLRLTSNSTNIILNDGVTFTSTTTLGGVTYTWPGAATAGYVLQANNTGASSTLSWVDPAAAVASTIYWTQANGVLFPKSNTTDVLIGSDSTASADFAFTGVDGGLPTASIAGTTPGVATYLTGEGNLATTNSAPLTVGNTLTSGPVQFFNSSTFVDQSGNLTLAGDLAVNGGNITSTGALTVGTTGQNTTLQGAVTTITSNGAGNDIILNSADTIELQDNTNVTGTLTAGTTAGFAVDATGNITSIGGVAHAIQDATGDLRLTSASTNIILNDGVTFTSTTTLNGVTYTWPATATAGYVLQSGNSGASSTLSWVDPAAAVATSIYWTSANGALYPKNNTLDVLIGSDSTASADFAFTGVDGGTPTASIAGTTPGVATYLTGEGNLATTNSAPLTLGNTLTSGPVQFFNSSTNIDQTGNLTLAGNAAVNGGNITSTGGLNITPGGALVAGVTGQDATLQGAITTITSNGAGNDIILNSADTIELQDNTNITGTLTAGTTAGFTVDATGNITKIGGVAHTIADAAGDLSLTSNSNNINLNDGVTFSSTTTLGGVTYTWPGTATAGYVLQSGNSGASSTLSWVDPAAAVASSIYWTQANGVLFPKNNTVDVLIGSDSTASADFAFTGVDGGLPTASIAGTTTGVATYLTGEGNLATTNSAPLTLGNTLTSGAVQFFNSSTNIDASGNLTLAGNAAVNGGNITSTGGLNITPGGALVAGVTGQNATLQGAVTTITSNGAGNDIILNSADTIELQDNTNITGTLTAGTTAGFSVDATGNITKIGGVAHTIADAAGDLSLTSNSNNINLNDGVTFSSTTTLGGVTYTWPGTATAGYVLQSGNTGSSSTLSWVDPAAAVASTIYWTQANGVLFPKNNTVDVLIGSDATASADFAFTGVDGGLPTASIAGTTTNVALYLTGNGNIATTNSAPLILGNALTSGAVEFFNSSTNIDASGNLTLAGNAAVNGGNITSTGGLNITPGGALVAGVTGQNATLQGAITTITSNGAGNDIILNSADTIELQDNTNITGNVDATGTASISGSLTFKAGTGTIQTTTASNLVLGGNTTGNIILSPSNDVAGGFIAPNTNANTDLGAALTAFRNIYGTTIYTGGSARLDATGNLTNIGTTQLNGVTYTWPASTTNGFILQSLGTGTSASLAWVDPSAVAGATIYWTQNNGVLYPKNSTVDVLIGSDSTASAKFAFTGVDGGLPTASIAGTGSVATYLTGDGNLATTNSAPLTLGNTLTSGPVQFFNSSTNIDQSGNLTLAGNAAVNGGNITSTTSLNITPSAALSLSSSGGGSDITLTSADQIILNAGSTIELQDNTNVTGTLTAGTTAGFTVDASGNITKIGGVAHSIANVTGDLTLASNSNYINLNDNVIIGGTTTLGGVEYTWPGADGSTGQVLSTDGLGTLSWTTALTASSVFWTQNDATGVLYPKNNTVDVLIGSDSTASAKFAFTGVAGGVPTASITGNIAGVATYLTGNGNLATTNSAPLTLGNTLTSGPVEFFNSSNNIDSSGNLTIAGNLAVNGGNITSTGALTVGTTGQNTTLQGAVTNITSNGAGNDITLTSADQIILNAGSTIELQDNTNVTGNIDATGTASISGSLTFKAGTGTIQTTTASDLVLGGDTSGNIILSPSNDVAGGFIAPNVANVTDLGTSTNYFRNIFGGVVNAVTSINTGAGTGTARIDATGNLTNIGTTQFNTVTYTWPGTATAGYVLQSGNSGASSTLSWVDPAAAVASSIYWTQANGVLFPKNNTVDVLIGSDSTASADFAFTGVDGGLPTASIAGTTTNVALYLTGNGNIATTNSAPLILGNTLTSGPVEFFNSNTSIDQSGNLTLAGNAAVNGGNITSTGGLNITPGGALVAGVTGQNATLQGAITTITSNGAGNDIILNSADTIELQDNTNVTGNLDVSGTLTSGTANGFQVDATGNIVSLGGVAHTIADAAGDLTLTSNSNNINLNDGVTFSSTTTLGGVTYTWPATATAGYVLQSGNSGASSTLSWVDPAAAVASSIYWTAANGVLYPKNNTYDVLIGSDSTASADFSFTGVDGGLPTASIAGTTTNVALYLTGNGNIATTNSAPLTLGNALTSGAVEFFNSSTNIDASGNLTLAGDAAVNGGDITSTGGLNITPGGALVAGVTGQNATLQGAVTTITSNGAGNDIILNSADTIELQDNTNITGTLTAGTTAGFTVDATGNISKIGGVAHAIQDASGDLRLTSNSTNIILNDGVTFASTTTLNGVTYTWPGTATAGYVLQSGNTGASSTLSWVDPAVAVASSIYWTSANGALFPKNNTLDVLIGSDSTASADFAFTGVDGGLPTASIAGTTTNVALYLTGNGNIATTNSAPLTLGNALTSGAVEFFNSSTNIDASGNLTLAGDAAVNGGDITSTGGLNITPGGALVAGVTGQNATLQGAITTITSNGAGNDITLTSADQIILNATTSIELQDNTNITGNLDVSGTLTSGTANGFQVDATGNIVSLGGVAHTIADSSGDLSLTSNSNNINLNDGVTFSSTTTLGGVTYTWPATATAGYVLQSGNSGASSTLSWVDPAAAIASSIYWTQANGILYPKNNTVDVLIGSDATASADFAFTGVDGGLPTASIAGTTANVALYLTGNGNIATTNSAPLTLGNALTSGAVEFFNSTNNIDSAGNLTIAGDLAVNGGNITSTGALTVGTTGQNTTLQGAITTITSNGAGNDIILNSADTIELQDNTNVTGTLTAGTTAGFTVDATGNITKIGGVAHSIADSTGDLTLTSNSTNINLNDGVTFSSTTTLNGVTYTWPATATAGYVLQSGNTGSSSTLSWVDPAAAVASQIYWTQANGVLFPKNNTVDVLIGSDATTSADFAFTGVDGGLPTASIAGTTTNVALYLTGNGNIATTNSAPLTLGNTLTSGPVQFFNSNTNIDQSGNLTLAGNAAVNGGNITTTSAGTATIFNANATTVNIGGGATAAVNIGPSGNFGTVSFSGGSGDTGCTITGTTGNLTCDGDFAVNGGDITSTTALNITPTGALSLSSSGAGNDITLTSADQIILNSTGTIELQDSTNVTGVLTAGTTAGFQVNTTGNIVTIGGVAHSIANSAGDLTLTSNSTNINLNDGVTFASTTTIGGVTYTWPAAATAGYVLQAQNTGASSTLSWVDPAVAAAGSIFWTQDPTLGILYPKNNTVDVLIGSNATTSAKFAFTGVDGGLPTASIAGTGSVATYLTGNGNLATTNSAPLTLGNSLTSGPVQFFNSSTSIDASGNLTLAGDAAVNGGDITSTGALNITPGGALVAGVTGQNATLQGAITTITSNGAGNDIILNSADTIELQDNTNVTGTLTAGTTAGFTVDATGNITKIGGVAHTIADSSGDLSLTSNSSNINLNDGVTFSSTTTLGGVTYTWPATATAGYVLQSGNSGASSTLSWVDPAAAAAASIFWTQDAVNGVLYPKNSTVDVLIGSNATASAKFAFTGVDGGLPTASIAGTGSVATYLTGDGTLSTTNAQDLTLGSAFTGNVIINSRGQAALTANGADLTTTGTFTLPNSNTLTGVASYTQFSNGISVGGATTFHIDSTGNVVAGDVAVNGGDITSTGALNITPTGALVAGVTGQDATLQGAITTITSNGATNDITLTSADQIILNATTTIELQDNTNITGTLSAGTTAGFTVDASGNITKIGGVTHSIQDLAGDLTLTSNSSNITLNDGVTVAGDLAVNGGDLTTTQTTANLFTNATTLGIGNGAGTTTINGALAVTGDTNLNGNSVFGNAVSDTIQFVGKVNSNILPSADLTYDLGALPSNRWRNIYAGNVEATTFVQNGFNVCDSSGANCPPGAVQYWNQTSGVLYPVNNSVDLLIGSDSTVSAKFAFTGVDGGLPTASIAGTTTGVATYLTGEGNLATTNQADLILGGADTGSVIINSDGNLALTATGANLTTAGTFTLPNSNTLTGVAGYTQFSNGISVGGATTFHIDSSGNVVAGDVAVNGGDITSTGGLNITPTGALSLSSSGAGNDITLTSADQIILNAGSTIELQDNTNVTGNIDATGTASISGSLTFKAGAAAIQSTTDSPLTIGGDTTGNITLNPLNSIAGGYVAPNTTNVTDLGTASLLFRNIFGTTIYQGVNQVCDMSNNCGYATGTNFWNQNLGALYTINNTVDVLIGGDATTSADFAFTGVNGGLPTASIAGTTTDVALYLTGNGNIATTNSAPLILGNALTSGAVEFFNSNTNIDASGNLTLAGDAAVNGGDITSTGALNITPGGALVAGVTGQNATLQGAITTITSNGAGNDIILNSADTIELQDATNITGNLSVSTGTITGANSEQLLLGVTNDIVQVVRGGNTYAVCDESNNCGYALGVNYWGQSAGALYPLSSTTDLLIGSTATASAKFAFTGVDGGLPTASIAGTTTDVALYLTGNGNIATTNSAPLLLGNTLTSGPVEFFGATTNIDQSGNLTLAGDAAVNGGDITSTGALNITPGGALVAGVTGQNATLQGAITTITSNGAGNDIILNSADTIELQDNTNIAGDLGVNGATSADITTTTTTASLFNATATTINIGTTDAVAINLGAANVDLTLGANGEILTASGNLSLQPAGTGTTANVQIGAGGVGSATPDLLVLDVKSTAGDPTGTNGAMYYNADSNKMRCYVNGAWDNCGTGGTGSSNWTLDGLTGVLYSNSATADVLIGGTATASSRFAFMNVDSAGAATASIAGTPASNNAIFIDGNGNISTTDRTDLTLGNSAANDSTGNILLQSNGTGNVGIGDATPLSMFTVGSGDKFQIDSTGRIVQIEGFAHTIDDVAGSLTLNSASSTIVLNDTVQVAQDLYSNAATANLFNSTTTNLTFAGAATTLNIGPAGATAATLNLVGGSGATGCTADGATGDFVCSGSITSLATTGTQGWWQLNNKILSPANTTYDLTVGGTATGSAFQAFGVESTTGDVLKLNSSVITSGNVFEATASAITNGNIIKLGQGGDTSFAGTGIYMDFDNTGGGSFTGNFLSFNNASSNKLLVTPTGAVESASGFYPGNGAIQTTRSFGDSGTFLTASNLSMQGELSMGNQLLSHAAAIRVNTDILAIQNTSGNDKFRFKTSTGALFIGGASAADQDPIATLDVRGTASISGTLTMGFGAAIQPAYGPLTLNYKSGADAWTAGLTLADITGNATIANDLAVNGGDLTSTATTFNFDIGNTGTLNFRDGTNTLASIIDEGTTGRLAVSDSLQVGGLSTVAYSRFGTASTTSHTGNLTTPDDVLINGDLEVDTNFYLDGNQIFNSGGTATIILSSDLTTSNSVLSGSWLIDNQANPGQAALMVNQGFNNDIFDASSAGTLVFSIANNGDTTVGSGGLGKLTTGTVDPPYTINGQKYATYLPGMAGVKEEVTGNLATNEYVPGKGYRNVIDFNSLPEGSDLWLFGKATDIKNNIDSLVALLTPADSTRTWYEVDKTNYKLAVYSARPTEVSYRLSGPRFDYLDHPNQRLGDAAGFVLNIPDVVNTNEIATTIQTLSNYIVENIGGGVYRLKDETGTVIDGIESIGNLVAANIKAGAVQTQDLIAQRFETNIISPVPGNKDITVQIGSATESGKLAIQNAAGTEVASIDDAGNATFSGTVKSQNIDNIQALLTQVSTDQSVLSQIVNSQISTTSANLSNLITSDLYVTGQAAINSLSVSTNISLGTDFVMGSDNTINTLANPLKIQSLAMAPVEIMSGLVTIDTHGNVNIAGDLNVAGRIKSSGLTLKDNAATPESLLTLQNSTGSSVATVDASGSAIFNTLATGGLTIAGASEASASALVNGTITTNSTVGNAVIPAGVSEITIKNPKVTDYTLVYVTPTSSTANYVLYIKSKVNGQFVVGFDTPPASDVTFNWWIVQVQ